jgi:pimeloyl-ACP methyl ester carboxylesterase
MFSSSPFVGALALAGALASPLTATAAALPATASDAAPVPVLNWQPCTRQFEAGFSCATAQVPIDYSKPNGKTFTLALIKYSADDQGNRIGTLFWNPGGPSDVGTQYLPAAIDGFPEQVRSRFDIVSWDPRGMGGDTRPVVQCFDSQEQETQFLNNVFSGIPDIPTSLLDLTRYLHANITLNQKCVSREGSLLAHVSTADNARDLDLLRQAVGDKKINYYGTSYGTFLGATYLNMFPEKVRASVFDGAVYPTAWAGNDKDSTTLSTFVRIGSDIGSAETISAFLSACAEAGVSGCAFADETPEATQQKWNLLLRRLKIKPVTVGGTEYDDLSLIDYMDKSLYTIHPLPGFGRFPGYVAVANLLQNVWSLSKTGSQSSASSAMGESPTSAAMSTSTSTYITSYGRGASVLCGESPNPTTVSAYIEQALTSYQRAGPNMWPLFGVCLGWSVMAQDAYLGPWKKPTPPVLVIGNTFDPATPYSSSKRMARELFDGHFLTVDGFGHTELLNTSRCAQDYIAAYLIDGTLPPDGTKCMQDYLPFSLSDLPSVPLTP